MALCKSQKETLTKKCNLTNSKHLIEAYREIEKGSRPAITFPDVEFPQMDLDKLQATVNSLSNRIRTLTKNNSFASPSTTSASAAQEKSKEAIPWDFIVHLCNCAGANKHGDKEQHVSTSLQSTNTYLPECIKRVANLYNPKRNKTFHEVVHLMEEESDLLVCRTDDFAFGYNNTGDPKFSMAGLWSPHVKEMTELLGTCRNVLQDPNYYKRITETLQKFEIGLHHLKNGGVEIQWEAHDETK